MSVYPVTPPPSGFEAAVAAFGRLLDQLTGDALGGADHAAAERFVQREGTEVMRQLFEAWLNARAEAEAVRDVVGSDQVTRTHHRSAARPMESVFGTVTVVRDRVGARGASALAPVDAVLNLSANRFSFGVLERACRYVVMDRMDITGAGWGLPGAEAVLRLRSLHASDDLDLYWEFHREREFARNHVSHYAGGEMHWLARAAA